MTLTPTLAWLLGLVGFAALGAGIAGIEKKSIGPGTILMIGIYLIGTAGFFALNHLNH